MMVKQKDELNVILKTNKTFLGLNKNNYLDIFFLVCLRYYDFAETKSYFLSFVGKYLLLIDEYLLGKKIFNF